jgi:hypothetical protein
MIQNLQVVMESIAILVSALIRKRVTGIEELIIEEIENQAMQKVFHLLN